MKRRYQIEQQRAVQQFRRLATEANPNIQMILPMADIVGLLQQGVGHLLRQADDVGQDRKSTRLNSSHTVISYAVFCLKKKTRTVSSQRPSRQRDKRSI